MIVSAIAAVARNRTIGADNDLAWNDVDRLGDVNIDLVRHMVCAESIVPYPTVIYEQFFRTYISTLGQSDGLDHLSAAVHAIGLTQDLPLRTIQQLREDPAFFSSDKNDQSRRPLVLDDFHDARSVADTPLIATGEEIATVEESTEENESKAAGQVGQAASKRVSWADTVQQGPDEAIVCGSPTDRNYWMTTELDQVELFLLNGSAAYQNFPVKLYWGNIADVMKVKDGTFVDPAGKETFLQKDAWQRACGASGAIYTVLSNVCSGFSAIITGLNMMNHGSVRLATYVNDTHNPRYPNTLIVLHGIGPDFRDSQNVEEFKAHFKILVDVYRQIFKIVIGMKRHSSPLYLTAISTGRFLGKRIHMFHLLGGHMTMAAIGNALKALSEDPSISAPDIKSIQQAITLVVLPEPNGNRFSRLSTVCDQPSNLAVEADSVEIGLESNRVMETWKLG